MLKPKKNRFFKIDKGILTLALIFALCLPVLAEKLGDLEEIMKPGMIDVDGDTLYISEGATIFIYSIPEMKLKKKFGKQGEGPGEFAIAFQRPIRVAAYSGYLLVETANKIIYFSKDGVFQKERKKANPFYFKITPIGRNFVVRRLFVDTNAKKAFSILGIHDEKMKEIKQLYKQEYIQQGAPPNLVIDMAQDFINFQVADNKVFVEESPDGFIINVYDENGQHLNKITKDYEKIKITQEQRDEIIELFKQDSAIAPQVSALGGWNEFKKLLKFKFPAHFIAIQNLECSRNKLYVETSKVVSEKVEYFILDLKGKTLKKVFIPRYQSPSFMGKLYGEKLSTIENGILYYLSENEDEEIWELHREEIK